MKRAFDFVGAIVAVILTSPILFIAALVVRFTSDGPIFFRQDRVGFHGKSFEIYKFRSMYLDQAARAGQFDAGDSSRVTRAGSFLRKTKIDELPQLFNVLRGEMSLVGPRPEVQKWVDTYPDRWAKVLKVRPGITDPASIVFRHEERILAAAPNPEQMYREQILPQKLSLYETYVDDCSFIVDVTIVLKTFIVLGKSH